MKTSVELSYEPMGYTQADIKASAKENGVTVSFPYSGYVSHKGLSALGGKRALTKFLRSIGLGWGVTFIGNKP